MWMVAVWSAGDDNPPDQVGADGHLSLELPAGRAGERDNDAGTSKHREIEASGREVVLSTFVWDWRDNIQEKLKEWQQLGVARTFITFWEPFEKLELVGNWMQH